LLYESTEVKSGDFKCFIFPALRGNREINPERIHHRVETHLERQRDPAPETPIFCVYYRYKINLSTSFSSFDCTSGKARIRNEDASCCANVIYDSDQRIDPANVHSPLVVFAVYYQEYFISDYIFSDSYINLSWLF